MEKQRYTPKDLETILKMEQSFVYRLVRSNAFPSFRINNRYYITKSNLEKWLNSNTNRTFLI